METISGEHDSSCEKSQNTYDLSEYQKFFIEWAEDETKEWFKAFLQKLNEIPNEEAREGAINAYSTFFTEYSKFKKGRKLNGKTIGKLLTTLKHKLERLPQGEPILQFSWEIASGKSHLSEDIITIIHECWWTIFPWEKVDQSQESEDQSFDPKKYLVENDVTEHFDKVILTKLWENRDGDFFSQYLRDIGYLTMGLFNGVHVAPFKKGTDSIAFKALNKGTWDNNNNKNKVPLIVIEIDEDQRSDNYVDRDALRDIDRPYMEKLSNKEVMKASQDPKSSIYRIRNNDDFNETFVDIFEFIRSNKEHFQITKTDNEIYNIIEKVLAKKKEHICKQNAKKKIFETLIENKKNPLFSTENINDFFSKKYKEETNIRNDSYLKYTINILKKYKIDQKTQGSILKSIQEELLHQQERDSFAYFTFDNDNVYYHIVKNLLGEKYRSNSDKILKDLQNKCPKINEASRCHYVTAITRRELMKLRNNGEKAKLINSSYFDYTCNILNRYNVDQETQNSILNEILNTLEIQQKKNPFAYFTFDNDNEYYNIIKEYLENSSNFQSILKGLQNKCPKIDESLTYDEFLREFMGFEERS